MLKKIIYTASILLMSASAFAQLPNASEFGVTAGISYYSGDFHESIAPAKPQPMVGIFYRHNFTNYLNARLNLSYGFLKGDSKKFGELPSTVNPDNGQIDITNDYKFSRDYIGADLLGEFNFLPYSSLNSYNSTYFSPYLILGVGVNYVGMFKTNDVSANLDRAAHNNPDMYSNKKSTMAIVIPMGLGFKYCFKPQWTVGIEWIVKKTFIDDIDRFTNAGKGGFSINNKDWISTIGLTLSYRIDNSGPCAAYDINKAK